MTRSVLELGKLKVFLNILSGGKSSLGEPMFYQYFSEKKNPQDFVEMQARLHRKTKKYHVESTPVGSPVEFGIARER